MPIPSPHSHLMHQHTQTQTVKLMKAARMAVSKQALLASTLLALLALHLVQADHLVNANKGTGYPKQTIDCGGACKARCRLSSRPNLCHRACGTCCARCSCVPPGTSGNTDVCPCYASLTTHGGRKKCP